MTAEIESGELYRIIWNALLFVDKNSPTGAVAEFNLDDDRLIIRTADAYSGLIERTWLGQDSYHGNRQWWMSKEYLQDLSKKLRANPNSFTDLLDLEGAVVTEEQAKAWQDFHYLSTHLQPVGETNGFAFSHDRLKLLYRVRSGGDYPLILRMSELPSSTHPDEPIIEYRIGPDIRGYVAPLDSIQTTGDWQLS